jgi:hypothetical protein
MRRHPQTLREYPPPSKLFLNDLERIHRILREGDDVRRVEILSGGYEFDEPAQLAELGERAQDLTMQAYGTGLVSLDLRKGQQLSLYASEDSADLSITVRDIREVLAPRRRPLARFYRPLVWSFVAGASLGAGAQLLLVLLGSSDVLWRIVAGALALMVAILGSFRLFAWSGSIVYTFPIEGRSGWWVRNRDGLVVGLILVVAGFLLGYFFAP